MLKEKALWFKAIQQKDERLAAGVGSEQMDPAFPTTLRW